MKSTLVKTTVVALITVLLGLAALQTGLARQTFFTLFTYVKGANKQASAVERESPTDSPYERWLQQARNELPVFEGSVIDDVNTIELRPWPQMGEDVSGLYLRFANYQINDGRILQIPATGRTVEQRHLYEKAVYVLDGGGYTEIRQEGERADRIDWAAGDLLSVPLNVRHSHHADPNGPARLLAVTTFPLVMNLLNERELVRNSGHVFYGRYDGNPGYFSGTGEAQDLVQRANYIKDLRETRLHPFDYRGQGNRSSRWEMAGNSMLSMHVSELPPRMYKKAHRHTSDAFILLLSGEGFSLAWPENAFDRRIRVDWQPGTLFVPPTYWYHQHLNTGSIPARYLAINAPTVVRNLGLRFIDQLEVDLAAVREVWEQALAE